MKRLLDIAGTAAGLIFLSPVFLVLAFLIRRRMGPPAIFAQRRAGLRGKPFVLYKFRSMNDARDGQGELLPDELRLTEFGKFLRRLSLDELPQLWNVLKGDMSLVGPRPLLLEYVPLYDETQKKRLSVKPGITGWAQINGRNAISWDEKFALDVWYVEHRDFWLDLRILWLTVWKILRREGISAPGEATMPRFTGNSTQKGMQMRVDHVGYAVQDVESARPLFEELGYRLCQSEAEDPARGVKICFLRDPAGVKVELIAPLRENSPVSAWLRKNGNSPYHICYQSADLAADIANLKKKGFILVEPPAPAAAMAGRRVAFLYGKSTGLIELAENQPGKPPVCSEQDFAPGSAPFASPEGAPIVNNYNAPSCNG